LFELQAETLAAIEKLERKRKSQSRRNKSRGKKNARTRLAIATSKIRAQVSEANSKLLEAQQQVAQAEAASERAAASSSKAISNLKRERSLSSKAIKSLNDQVRELENNLLILEEELDEKNLDDDMASNERARRNARDAEFLIAGASADNEHTRKHSFGARLALHQILALGVPPSSAVAALSISGRDVFEGHPPGVSFVRKFRQELRVVVCTLAAATAARSDVSFIHFSQSSLLGLFRSCYYFVVAVCSVPVETDYHRRHRRGRPAARNGNFAARER